MTKEIKPYQKRVIDEARDLWVRAEMLDTFIKNNNEYMLLPEIERHLLFTQLNAMRTYGNILDARITQF